jgi:hypothetical protein
MAVSFFGGGIEQWLARIGKTRTILESVNPL